MLKSGGEFVEGDMFLVFLQVVSKGAEVRTWSPRMGQGNILERVCRLGLINENGGGFMSPKVYEPCWQGGCLGWRTLGMVGIAVPEKLSKDVEMSLAGRRGELGKSHLDEMRVRSLQF